MPRNDVELDTRKLNEILRNVPGNRWEAVRAVGFSVQAKAQEKAPVDTGALRASIYTETGKAGDYTVAAGNVQKLNPEAQLSPLPNPEKDTVHVGPSVDYGIWLELGTEKRAATPYLLPAVNEVERDLAKHFKKVVTDE